MLDLLEHIERTIRERKLFRRGERILVAVSGGSDSMTLLRVLHALAAKNRWKLSVAHFNHQLRGRSSDADAQFVRKTAAALGVPFVTGRGSVKRHGRETRQSVEMAARDLRHKFLAQSARRLKCRTIALAHHADDQVELFFLRLLRGAGGEGLAGMKWRGPSPADSRTQLVRPLLDVRRSELDSHARESKIRFRDDSSNASLDFRRNRVRHELLPVLKSRYQPGLAKTVLRLMDVVGKEAEFVTEAAERWLAAKPRPAFTTLAVAVQRRCLQLQLHRFDVAADYQLIEWLRQKPNRPVSINPAIALLRDEAGLVRSPARQAAEFRTDELGVLLNERAGEVVFSGVRFRWRVAASRSLAHRRAREHCEFFDADEVGSNITLRHWRPGDRFQPMGMPVPVKLQDWFTNQKIPAARRHELVVAATEAGEIFWIEKQRISERFKLTAGTRRRLIWLWQKA